jgi:hypothetical protein
VSNSRTGLVLREAARAGKLARENVAKANVSTTDRRDIMLISRFLSAKIEHEVRRAVADLPMAQPARYGGTVEWLPFAYG